MKLLRDFFHLRLAGIRGAASRSPVLPRDFNVTVPAPLAQSATAKPVAVELPCTSAKRREPASFLRSSRHLRLGNGRR